MNKCFLVLLTTAITFMISAFIMPKSWISYQKEDYTISFPGKPTYDSTTAKTELGDVKVFQYNYESTDPENDSTVVYQLIKTTYPTEFPLSTDKVFLKGFFESAVKATVAKIKGKLLSEKELTLKNYPGKELTMVAGNGEVIVKMRMLLAGQTVFGLQTISAAGKENNVDATHFYNSFTIK